MSGNLKIAYLASCYPCVSHTFITREVSSLRDHNMEIHTFSMNNPMGPFSINSDEIRDQKQTIILRKDLLRKSIGILIFKPRLSMKWLSGMSELLRNGHASWLKKLGYGLEGLVLANELQKKKIDHLHVHFVNPAADVAKVAARTIGIKWSISVHGPDSMEDISKFDFIRRVQGADHVRVISEYARQQVLRHAGPKLADKISIIHCGVNPPQRKLPSPIRNRDLAGLTVGRLVGAKGQIFLLQALYRLKRSYNYTPKWDFIGRGPDQPMLEAVTKELGLRKQVTFHGARDQGFVQRHLDQCDVFALPSLAEGIPVSLMEAMAKSKPVISCATNGIPELIQSDVNGYLCEPGNVDSLTRTLCKVIENPERAAAIAYMGRSIVERNFNSDVTGREMRGLFIQVNHDTESKPPNEIKEKAA